MKEELMKLKTMLEEANIPFEVRSIPYILDGEDCQICYPSYEGNVCDAVCHSFSYGNEKGLLEIMGLVDETLIGDIVEGQLTAEEVFKRISHDWEFRKAFK